MSDLTFFKRATEIIQGATDDLARDNRRQSLRERFDELDRTLIVLYRFPTIQRLEATKRVALSCGCVYSDRTGGYLQECASHFDAPLVGGIPEGVDVTDGGRYGSD